MQEKLNSILLFLLAVKRRNFFSKEQIFAILANALHLRTGGIVMCTRIILRVRLILEALVQSDVAHPYDVHIVRNTMSGNKPRAA